MYISLQSVTLVLMQHLIVHERILVVGKYNHITSNVCPCDLLIVIVNAGRTGNCNLVFNIPSYDAKSFPSDSSQKKNFFELTGRLELSHKQEITRKTI